MFSPVMSFPAFSRPDFALDFPFALGIPASGVAASVFVVVFVVLFLGVSVSAGSPDVLAGLVSLLPGGNWSASVWESSEAKLSMPPPPRIFQGVLGSLACSFAGGFCGCLLARSGLRPVRARRHSRLRNHKRHDQEHGKKAAQLSSIAAFLRLHFILLFLSLPCHHLVQ
jgi:hypothetical protein